MALITTIYGDMEADDLIRSEGNIDTERETTYWVEYRKPGSDEIIHRSVHMILKEMPVFATAEVGKT